jgi:23S rRNA (cytidine2498-2'-O)-methyltransferase
MACQAGAEATLRQRAAVVAPGLRPAAWRRGVVTFRVGETAAAGDRPGTEPGPALLAELVFARAAIHSLGQVTGKDPSALAHAAVSLATASGTGFATVHAWSRTDSPGRGPRLATDPAPIVRASMLESLGLPADTPSVAALGDLVLDCVIDEPGRAWVGWHRAADAASAWPGGVYPAAAEPLPPGVVSRAWLKLDEAIGVFGIPLVAGERAIELGAAPGGACQRLLEAGLRVVAVDPALLDPAVVTAAGLTHWRMRARDVPLERFRGCDWLVADMNIDPTSTLAALGRVASAPGVHLAGIIATLKIPDWSRATELPVWIEAFRSWGFEPRARQLSSAGREVCVVARPAGSRPVGANASRPRPRRRPARRRRAE